MARRTPYELPKRLQFSHIAVTVSDSDAEQAAADEMIQKMGEVGFGEYEKHAGVGKAKRTKMSERPKPQAAKDSEDPFDVKRLQKELKDLSK
jgi:hypothetical protein